MAAPEIQAPVSATSQSTGGERRRWVVGAGAILLLLGVPVLLMTAWGVPFVDSSWSGFSQSWQRQLDYSMVLTALAYVAWAAWGSLVVALLVAIWARLAKREVPRIWGLSWQQRIAAAALVGLVWTTTAGQLAGPVSVSGGAAELATAPSADQRAMPTNGSATGAPTISVRMSPAATVASLAFLGGVVALSRLAQRRSRDRARDSWTKVLQQAGWPEELTQPDLVAVTDLDRSLRLLSRTGAPDLTYVLLFRSKIQLFLRFPLPAPHPWQSSPDNLTWTLRAGDFPQESLRGPAPYPALVSVGVCPGSDPAYLLVDPESTPIVLRGPADVCAESAASAQLELRHSPWGSHGVGTSISPRYFGTARTAAPSQQMTLTRASGVLEPSGVEFVPQLLPPELETAVEGCFGSTSSNASQSAPSPASAPATQPQYSVSLLGAPGIVPRPPNAASPEVVELLAYVLLRPGCPVGQAAGGPIAEGEVRGVLAELDAVVNGMGGQLHVAGQGWAITGVDCDLEVIQAQPTTVSQLTDQGLLDALALARGAVPSPHPSGQYGWLGADLAQARSYLEAVVTEAERRGLRAVAERGQTTVAPVPVDEPVGT